MKRMLRTLSALIVVLCGTSVLAGEVNRVTVTVTFSEQDVTLGQEQGYDTVTLNGGQINQNLLGVPAVPYVYKNILLPAGTEAVSLMINDEQRTLLADGLDLIPVQQPQKVSDTEPAVWTTADEEAYRSEDLYPVRAAYLDAGTQKLRGWHFAEVKVCPLSYVAATGELYLSTSITLAVTVEDSGKTSTVTQEQYERFAAQVKALVVNPDQLNADPQVVSVTPKFGLRAMTLDVNPIGEGEVDYLIVTPEALAETFAKLAEHRESFNDWGTAIVTIETIEETYSGDDIQAQIRNCIIDYVENYGTSFVVLGGDEDLVPDRDCYCCAWECTSDNPTDQYYAGLDGTWDDYDNDGVYGEVDVDGVSTHDEYDKYADVYVGRISVTDADQALAYINKVITYENRQDKDLMNKVMLSGYECFDTYEGDDRPNAEVADGHVGYRDDNHPYVCDSEYWLRTLLYKDLMVDQGWEASEVKCLFETLNTWDNNGVDTPTTDYHIPTDDIITRLSEGWQFMFHQSHGGWQGIGVGGDLSYSDALELTGMVNFIHTGACLSNGFDLEGSASGCFSENLLRNPDGGSLAYLGCSRENASGISEELGYEFADLIAQGVTNLGELFYEHKLIADLDNQYERWVFYNFNLLGDPGLYVAYDCLGTNLALSADLSASYVSSQEDLEAIRDDNEPSDSGDTTGGYYEYRNDPSGEDTWHYVQMDFDQTYQIDSTLVYWVATRRMPTPSEAYFAYLSDGSWVKTGDIGVAKNQWNTLSTDVLAQSVRLYMIGDESPGLLEWQVWGEVPDFDPPTPDPATWAVTPTLAGRTSVTMTATTGEDASDVVEYYFAETSGAQGGDDSGWQTSSTYTDTGFSAGTTYRYTVQMRDLDGNVGTVSSEESVTTSNQQNLALTADVSTSYVSSWETLEAVCDGIDPSSSSDNADGAYGNWRGDAYYDTWDYVQYDFDQASQIDSVEVYWWDDGAGIEQPYEAYVAYKTRSGWVKAGDIGVELDQWNRLETDLQTQSIRITMRSTMATGILEWQVWGEEE